MAYNAYGTSISSISARTFGTMKSQTSRAAKKSAICALPQGVDISGEQEINIQENFMDATVGLKHPKEYMFARSDFTAEREKLNETLDTGVLFRYHESNPMDIPVA